MNDRIEVRPFEHESEYRRMIDYFLDGGEEFQRGMGVDPARLPSKQDWLQASLAERRLPEVERHRFFLAWLRNGELVGHSSLSHIRHGREGHIHLHLWRSDLRRGGLGSRFFQLSVQFFFDRFELQQLVCEPYAGNAAPNRTVARLGFRLVRTYRTVPTELAAEQDVSRYELTREEWDSRYGPAPAPPAP